MDSDQLCQRSTKRWKASGWSVWLAIALLVLQVNHSSLAAAEEEAHYSKGFSACMEASVGVTSAMIKCIGHELELQETKLNAAYQKLLAKLDGGQQQRLKEAQRAWLAYRKANADYYLAPDGGTAARLASSDVYLRMTAERAAELERERERDE